MATSVIAQKIVSPEKIEKELSDIWEHLGKNTLRASLFNLIVYVSLVHRIDYFREIVQRVMEKFPSRVLFVSIDESKKNYLRTAVSIVFPKENDPSVACDTIDIGISRENPRRVSSLILSHLLPDLPIYLLWAEDPKEENPLFQEWSGFSHRLIFDSESSEDLPMFSKTLLHYNQNQKEIGDLNWARTEKWRFLLAEAFASSEKCKELQETSSLQIVYNVQSSEFFCHAKIQSLFLQAFLATRLHWQFERVEIEKESLCLFYRSSKGFHKCFLIPRQEPTLMTGAIVSVSFEMQNKKKIFFSRDQKTPHLVRQETFFPNFCELPISYVLERSTRGASLVNEILQRKTSKHFLEVLKLLSSMESAKVC